MSERLEMVIGVHLILRQNDQVFLARRYNTGFGDGDYNFPCGHLDPEENVKSGLIREAVEEVGVEITPEALNFVGVTHWRSNKQSINLFFECMAWQGDLVNNEPDKCDDVSWFSLSDLPENLVEQTRRVLEAYDPASKSSFFIEMGT